MRHDDRFPAGFFLSRHHRDRGNRALTEDALENRDPSPRCELNVYG